MPNYINRYLRLSIWPENANEPAVFGQDWKITFRVRKCASATFMSYNTAEISVYNMTTALQEKLSKRYLAVKLDAGYESMHDFIFVGYVYNAVTTKRTTDLITTFYCVSNMQAYEKLINECVNNMTVKDLIEKLCKENGISYSVQTKRKDVVQRSLTGTLGKTLTKLCSEYKITMSLDNGKLVFKDEEVPAETLHKSDIKVFTPNSGMLGNPTVTEVGIRFKSLLQPGLQVNDYFRLEAPYADYNLSNLNTAPGMVEGGSVNAYAHIETHTYKGVYSALSIVSSGDTRGNAWYTEVEGRRV